MSNRICIVVGIVLASILCYSASRFMVRVFQHREEARQLEMVTQARDEAWNIQNEDVTLFGPPTLQKPDEKRVKMLTLRLDPLGAVEIEVPTDHPDAVVVAELRKKDHVAIRFHDTCLLARHEDNPSSYLRFVKLSPKKS